MKLWIFGVVVPCRDEPRQPDESRSEHNGEGARPPVRKGGKAHEASCVYHGELVDKLHGVLQRGVEQGRTSANNHVAYKGNDKDGGMAILEAVPNPFETKPNEEEIRQGLHGNDRHGHGLAGDRMDKLQRRGMGQLTLQNSAQ